MSNKHTWILADEGARMERARGYGIMNYDHMKFNASENVIFFIDANWCYKKQKILK